MRRTYSAALGVVGGVVDMVAGLALLRPAGMMVSSTAMLGGYFLLILGSIVLMTGLYLLTSHMMKYGSMIGGLMVLYGVIMLVLGVAMLGQLFSMQGSTLSGSVMLLMGVLMLYSGYGMTNPFGRVRACPQCGSRVVNWGKRALTYCTSCSWYFGAIPESSSIMISGDPGVGKTMLTLKLAELSLSRGKRCIFVGCDQPPANTRKIVSEIHHSISRISEAISTNARNFIMVDAFSSAGKLKSEEPYHTTGIFDLNEMSHVVAEASDSSTFDPDLGLTIVVDSVNPLFLHRDASSVLKFLDHCRTKCVGRGDAFLFSITEGAIDQSVYRKLESMTDVVIEMKFTEETHGRRRRFRLTKIRGRNLLDEWVYFDIVPKEGIVVRPIEKPEIPA